mgnify:CR=1 FL=1
MIYLLIVLIIICLLYLLSLRGRTGHKGLQALQGWSYAHRGLHGNGVPENSMKAFRLALENGYGIELDVHLMADGNLAVIHDASLKRTAGADVKIEDLVTAQLQDYYLEGTQEQIPEFRQVLELFDGKAPLIIELKAERNNHAALSDAVCKMLESYNGAYCLESFDPRCIYWLRKNRPQEIRGQLSQNFVKNKSSKLPFILKWVLTTNILNFLTRPDFISYQFCDRKRLGVDICRKLWKIQGVTWTLRNLDEHKDAVIENWLPIFEFYKP